MKHKYLRPANLKILLQHIAILFLIRIATACKKEYPSVPYNEIVNFTIKDNNGKAIKGAIENNEITLYWPPEQAVPENISPIINISDKATIQPASGSTVPFNENTTFTVTAEDGSKIVYKLKPVINYTKPYISSVSAGTIYKDKSWELVSEPILINGDYFNTGENQTKVFFIKADNTEIPATISKVTAIRITVSTNTTGFYSKVKIITNNRTVLFDKAFEILTSSPAPGFFTPVLSSTTIKRGQRWTVTGGENMDKTTKIALFNSTTGDSAELRLIEATKNSWVLEIPENLPLGTYDAIMNTYPESSYYAGGTLWLMMDMVTITE